MICPRPNLFRSDQGCGHDKIIRTSRMVSQFTGLSVQRNKAIVGLNALRGWYSQDGVLKHQQTRRS